MREEIEMLLQAFRQETDLFKKGKIVSLLRSTHDMPLKDISRAVGLKPSYLCHLNRLNRIPEIVADGYYSDLITMSHLFILSRLKNSESIIKAYEQVLSRSLTIAQTEEHIRDVLYHVKTDGAYFTEEEKRRLITNISSGNDSVTVHIIQTRVKNKLVIEVKGPLSETSEVMKLIISKIKGWQKST